MIRLTCPEGHTREIPDDFHGTRASCLECGRVIDVAAAREAALMSSLVTSGFRPPAPAPQEDAAVACPACAELIKAAALKCRFCGHVVGAPLPTAAFPAARSKPRDKLREAKPGARWAAIAFLLAVAVVAGVLVAHDAEWERQRETARRAAAHAAWQRRYDEERRDLERVEAERARRSPLGWFAPQNEPAQPKFPDDPEDGPATPLPASMTSRALLEKQRQRDALKR